MSKPTRGLVILLLATSAVLLLSVVGLVGYWYGKRGAILPGEEAPPQSKKSSELAGVEWKTFSDRDLKFSFGYMTQYPNQSIKVRDASWGRYIDQEIPALSKLSGVSYTIKVYPASAMTEYYGRKVAGDKVWAEAVSHIKGFAPGSVADSTLMTAATFPVPIGQGKVVSSRSGELGVEVWFFDVPSGTLVHKVVFMVDPAIDYTFRTNYSLEDSAKWQELKDSVLSGTADEQYLLGYENFMLIVSTFRTPEKEDSTAGWKKYENIKYGFALSYPNDWDIELLDIPLGDDDFGFYLKPIRPSIKRSIVLTVQILRGETAKYRFGNCCKSSQKIRLGGKTFDKIGPFPIDGMIEVDHLFGNEEKLVEFSLGVGTRDDPLPLPQVEDVQKELSDVGQIISTFKFLE